MTTATAISHPRTAARFMVSIDPMALLLGDFYQYWVEGNPPHSGPFREAIKSLPPHERKIALRRAETLAEFAADAIDALSVKE